MNVVKCKNGHFYDADKFLSCPHCGVSAVKNEYSGQESSKEKIKKDVTIGIWGDNDNSENNENESIIPERSERGSYNEPENIINSNRERIYEASQYSGNATSVALKKRSKKLIIIVSSVIIPVVFAVVCILLLTVNGRSRSDAMIAEKPFSNSQISAYEKGLSYLSAYADNGDESDRDNAKEQFEIAGSYDKAEYYMKILIFCSKDDKREVVSELLNYSNDEYVQKILLSDKYIYDFFRDTLWVGESDKNTDAKYFLTFDENCLSDYNLPSFGRKNNDEKVICYKFSSGVYTTILNDGTENKYWKFEMLNQNEIKVFCYDGENTLYLRRSQ